MLIIRAIMVYVVQRLSYPSTNPTPIMTPKSRITAPRMASIFT
jgi:hypothetical protein